MIQIIVTFIESFLLSSLCTFLIFGILALFIDELKNHHESIKLKQKLIIRTLFVLTFIALTIFTTLFYNINKNGFIPEYNVGSVRGTIYCSSIKGVVFKSYEYRLQMPSTYTHKQTVFNNTFSFSLPIDANKDLLNALEEAFKSGDEVIIGYSSYKFAPIDIKTSNVVKSVTKVN